MDIKTILAVLALSASTALAGEKASADDFYRKGEAALNQGNLDAARAAYTQALRINPQHGNARYRLLSLKNLAPEVGIKVRERKLAQIRLPQVNFEGETLTEALEALGVLIEQASDGKFVPNFILEDPDKKVADLPVNLRLRGIPANVALKYVLAQGKARAVWEQHVINVRPLASGSTSATPPAKMATEPAPDPFKRPLQKK